jgi:hypothetical protein
MGANTNDGRREESTMMTHFFPEAFNCCKKGSLGERSNFGIKGRSFSMGRVMTLRGQLTSANEIEAKLARESAPAFDNPGRLFAFARRVVPCLEGISPAQNVTGRSHMRQMELSLGLRGLEHRASR